MTDEDRVRLIKVLLDGMDGFDSSDYLVPVLAEYFRREHGGEGDRMAEILAQFLDCEGPFARDEKGDVKPGRWMPLLIRPDEAGQ